MIPKEIQEKIEAKWRLTKDENLRQAAQFGYQLATDGREEDELLKNVTEDRNRYRDAFESQIVEIAQQDSDIAALQSSLKEKESRIGELQSENYQYFMSIEELKAENERLKRLVPDHPKANS